MRAARLSYLFGAVAITAAHGASGFAGFAALLLLSRIVEKAEIGGYAFAMAVVILSGAVSTLGLDRTMLMRVAQRAPREGSLRGRTLALRTTLAAFAAGAVVAVGLIIAADLSAGLDEVAAAWLRRIAFATPWVAAAASLAAWYQANHQVALAGVAPAVSDVARCLLFGLVWLTGAGAAGVGWSVIVAAAAPVALLAALARGQSTAAPGRLRGADFVHGAQFLSLRLATQSARQIDLLAVGLLSDAETTADYAVASRLAALADLGRTSLQPTFTPRIRRHIAIGDKAAGFHEYDLARTAALAAALLCGVAFLAAGPWALALFGDFQGAAGVMALLCAAYVVGAGFGMHQPLLAMAGDVRWSVYLRYAGLAALAAALWLLVPRYGAPGAGAAVLGVAVMVNGAGAFLARRLVGLKPMDPSMSVILAVAVGALAGAGVRAVSPDAAAVALGACLAGLSLRTLLQMTLRA